MSETICHQGRRIAVQGREIREAAYRSLCAAGADPLEAEEGGLAVLRAEAEAGAGLRLLEELLDADWAATAGPAVVTDAPWAGGTLRTHDGGGQPPLRTALQVLDLVRDAPRGAASVVLSLGNTVPDFLWNDLLSRRCAEWGSRIVVAAADSPQVPPQVDTALGPQAGAGTVIASLPEPAGDSQPANATPKSLGMYEEEWQRMYQLSRSYLVPDA